MFRHIILCCSMCLPCHCFFVADSEPFWVPTFTVAVCVLQRGGQLLSLLCFLCGFAIWVGDEFMVCLARCYEDLKGDHSYYLQKPSPSYHYSECYSILPCGQYLSSSTLFSCLSNPADKQLLIKSTRLSHIFFITTIEFIWQFGVSHVRSWRCQRLISMKTRSFQGSMEWPVTNPFSLCFVFLYISVHRILPLHLMATDDLSQHSLWLSLK